MQKSQLIDLAPPVDRSKFLAPIEAHRKELLEMFTAVQRQLAKGFPYLAQSEGKP